MTTSSNTGIEIIVPGRQNLQINAVIPNSGAPISLWQAPFFIIGEKKTHKPMSGLAFKIMTIIMSVRKIFRNKTNILFLKKYKDLASENSDLDQFK